jgi:hypothetical protein
VVIPLSGRVPGRASGPSRSRVDDGGGLQYVSWKIDRGFMFSCREEYIGGRAADGGGPGAHTRPWRGQGWPTPWGGAAASWPPLRLCFGLRDASGKIGTLAIVSSNSENISCVAFLKHKNSRSRELALWHLVNRLVLENA